MVDNCVSLDPTQCHLSTDDEADGVHYDDGLQLYRRVTTRVKGQQRYVIQRLVKPVVRKVNHQPTQVYEVKWEGYRDHTVEPRATLLLDVPHLVKRFERQHGVEWRGGAGSPSGPSKTWRRNVEGAAAAEGVRRVGWQRVGGLRRRSATGARADGAGPRVGKGA
jgi:hypothetical protein